MNTILDQIKTYGSKEIILNNGKRLCYLIACENCGELHYKAQCEILRGLRKSKKFFCSQKCLFDCQTTRQAVVCANCNTPFLKLPSQISKTKNNFCSKSCAATFNNKNKKYGTRRSKIEILIEDMLRTQYSDLLFLCNQKDTIGSELDFYFPDLKLAIQINGPLHYKPIYGQKKLDQIQRMDEEKRVVCRAQNIKLVELDYSEDKYLNKKKITERLNEIKIILEEGVDPDSNTLAGTAYFPGTVGSQPIHLP
jgi:hypothetical protein